MISLDSLSLMTEQEKLDLLQQISESEGWQDAFEPVYCKCMDDESPAVRQAAIVALWDLAEPRHIEPLMEKAQSDPDREVRAKAASVLGIYIYEGLFGDRVSEGAYVAVRKALLDLARDPDEGLVVRRMAIEALSFSTDESVQKLIDWAYEHPSIELKMTALFAMGRSRSACWFDTLLREIDSTERRLRIEAINAAAEAELAIATPKLRSLTASSDREIKLAAVWALAHTRGPGALETLEMCAESDDDELRRVANGAIEEFYEAGSDNMDTDDYDDEDEDEADDF